MNPRKKNTIIIGGWERESIYFSSNRVDEYSMLQEKTVTFSLTKERLRREKGNFPLLEKGMCRNASAQNIFSIDYTISFI